MIRIETTQSKQHADQTAKPSWWQTMKDRIKSFFGHLREAWKVDIIGGLSKELRSANDMRLHFGFLFVFAAFINTLRAQTMIKDEKTSGRERRFSRENAHLDPRDYIDYPIDDS